MSSRHCQHDDDAFGFDSLTYTENSRESMELNRRQGPFVVISASGMCENGRVVHHLKHSMTDEKNVIAPDGIPGSTYDGLAYRQPRGGTYESSGGNYHSRRRSTRWKVFQRTLMWSI